MKATRWSVDHLPVLPMNGPAYESMMACFSTAADFLLLWNLLVSLDKAWPPDNGHVRRSDYVRMPTVAGVTRHQPIGSAGRS